MTTAKRAKLVYDRHTNGETYDAIARDMGISLERARQLSKKWVRHIEISKRIQESWPDATLSVRTFFALNRLGIKNTEQLKNIIRTKGIIRAGGVWKTGDGFLFRNIGNAAWFDEIFPLLEKDGFDWSKYYIVAEPKLPVRAPKKKKTATEPPKDKSPYEQARELFRSISGASQHVKEKPIAKMKPRSTAWYLSFLDTHFCIQKILYAPN